MFKKALCVISILTLVACSSTKKNGVDQESSSAPIINQKLATNFKRKGITLEWDCSWGTGFSQATCAKGNFSAIEVTAYAPSFGNSEANREAAFEVAHDIALTKLNRFIQDEVSSSRVMMTMSKNIEKANDSLKSKIRSDEAVILTDEDPFPAANVATRENTNEVVRTVTESIRTQSSGILRGVRTVDERIVDRQTVATTIRWDKDSEQAVRELRKRIR
jgi:hypothetical protein